MRRESPKKPAQPAIQRPVPILQRQQDTLEVLYQRYNREVWAVAYAGFKNADTAMDITEESFLRLWNAWGTGKEIANPRAWLLRVARNLAVDHAKGASQRRWRDHPEALAVLQNVLSPELQPDEVLAGKELRRRAHRQLRRAWAALTEEDRILLALHVRGLTDREVGEWMDKSKSTVDRRLHALFARLRHRLANLPTATIVELLLAIIDEMDIANAS